MTRNIKSDNLLKKMEQYFLIWAAILIIGTLVFYVIMKNLLKTLATFIFILLLFVVITGTLTYSDIKSLQTKLENIETVYIFDDYTFGNSSPVLGIVKSSEGYREFIIVEKDYNEILKQNEYYRIIVITSGAYEGLHEPEEYIEIIKDTSNSFEERADAFITLNNAAKNKGIRYVMYEYKKNNVQIYPKTMLFKILNIIPGSWINFSEEE